MLFKVLSLINLFLEYVFFNCKIKKLLFEELLKHKIIQIANMQLQLFLISNQSNFIFFTLNKSIKLFNLIKQ